MLGKVYNINTSVSWDKNRHVFYHNDNPKVVNRSKPLNNDSLTVSAAFSYLKSISWLIKDLKKVKNDKLLILFNFNGFDFRTEIDLNTLDAFKHQSFEIEKDDTHEVIYFKANVTLLVQLNHLNKSKRFEESNLAYLSSLFSRLDNQGMSSNTLSADNYQNEFLIGDYSSSLLGEFRNIITGLSIFIEKFSGSGFQFNPLRETEELIRIEKIKTETTA